MAGALGSARDGGYENKRKSTIQRNKKNEREIATNCLAVRVGEPLPSQFLAFRLFCV